MSAPTRPSRRRRIRGEKGYVLVMTGLLLVPLVVFTAFGVDLGAWYAQGVKQQRTADAASLAGVVQLPNPGNAVSAAQAILTANGYSCTLFQTLTTSTPATSAHPCSYSYPTGNGEQMYVSIYQPAKQYFSGLVLKGEALTRNATAAYATKIPLGSPSNVFGNNLAGAAGSCTNPAAGCAGAQPLVWAAINGPYTDGADGDPYATQCQGGNPTNLGQDDNTGSANGCVATNSLYTNAGYQWYIDIPSSQIGNTVNVQLYDPEYDVNDPSGDIAGTASHSGNFNTQFQLFANTGSNLSFNLTPANGMDALAKCTGSSTGVTAGKMSFPASSTAAWVSNWTTLCSFTVPTFVGTDIIYPLVVTTPGTGSGSNSYAVKATTSPSGGLQPQVYAATNLSIYTNPSTTGDPGSSCSPTCTASFYLASIAQTYRNHTLIVDLYDPGDGNAGKNGFELQFLGPPGTAPATFAPIPIQGTPESCTYTNPVGTLPPSSWPNSSSNCEVQTQVANGSGGGVYNADWLEVKIPIPSTYTCSTDCWWSIQYHFDSGSTPTDRTTWTVNVTGDPVHLTS